MQGEQGYFLHDTVVFTPAGIPLGVLDAQTWARDPEEHGKKAKRKQKRMSYKPACAEPRRQVVKEPASHGQSAERSARDTICECGGS